MIRHIIEEQSWNDSRGVAGKRFAVRRDEQELAAPAAHAGLWKFRASELFARREKIFAVGESPSVILHVCEFDASGGRSFGQSEHFFDLVDVAAVDDKIESNGDAVTLEPFEHAEFVGVGLGAGDFVGGVLAGALKAKLHVVEAGLDESRKAGFIERQTRGDQVDVKTGGTRGWD